MSKLLIDADIVVFRAGFAVEKTQYLVTKHEDFAFATYPDKKAAEEVAYANGGFHQIWSRKEIEPEDKALMLADIILRDICERYPEREPVLFLSPSVGNFRELLATRARYKGNRDGASKPVHYKALREHLQVKWGAVETVGQEADDAIGIGMTDYPGSVCVSIDKDLLQIPGIHYNWVTKEETLVSKKEGALNFWQQVLTGDPVDNIPGLKGIGPVKAKRLLEGVKGDASAWDAVLEAYVEHLEANEPLAPLDAALETARLVYVRRKEGEMWSPPV